MNSWPSCDVWLIAWRPVSNLKFRLLASAFMSRSERLTTSSTSVRTEPRRSSFKLPGSLSWTDPADRLHSRQSVRLTRQQCLPNADSEQQCGKDGGGEHAQPGRPVAQWQVDQGHGSWRKQDDSVQPPRV